VSGCVVSLADFHYDVGTQMNIRMLKYPLMEKPPFSILVQILHSAHFIDISKILNSKCTMLLIYNQKYWPVLVSVIINQFMSRLILQTL